MWSPPAAAPAVAPAAAPAAASAAASVAATAAAAPAVAAAAQASEGTVTQWSTYPPAPRASIAPSAALPATLKLAQ